MSAEKKLWEDYLTVRELNEYHDEVMRNVVKAAASSMESGQGLLPARFSFLVMGSAGRREQSVWSDQDHALIYEGNSADNGCFLELGKRITDGLNKKGYALCEGKVMASEPRWCMPVSHMKEQVLRWLKEGTWESVRHALILMDARTLTGSSKGNGEIKNAVFERLRADRYGRTRILANTSFRMRRRNIFGKILTDQHDYFDFKETVLFPYINSARTAAVLEGVHAVNTIQRMEELGDTFPHMQPAAASFREALEFRHIKCRNKKQYEGVHLIHVPSMNREEKRMVKHWMTEGSRLAEQVHAYYQRNERKKTR